MGEQDYPKRNTTVPWGSSSLGRALIEGLWKTPAHSLVTEFGELRMLRATLNALAFAIAVLDSEGRILVANLAWQEATNAGAILGAGSDLESNYGAELGSAQGERAELSQALGSGIRDVLAGRCEHFLLEYTRPGLFDVRHIRARVNRCAGKEPCRAVVIHEDVSEQKHAEQANEQASRLLNAVLETALGGIAIAEGPDATIVRVNRRGQEMLNHSLDGAEGSSLNNYLSRWAVFHPDGTPLVSPEEQPFVRAIRTGEVVRDEELILRTADGTQFTLMCNASPVRDASGKIHGAIAAWRDETEGRLLAEQFRQSQKMEAVGRLAGGVAHDFNNLLMVIQGYSQMLRRRVSTDPYVLTAAEEIHKASERASALTRQLLAFSRKQVLLPQVLDLNTVVADMEGMLRRTIGEDIELVSMQDAELMPVKADLGQLEQVVLNLAANSRDAMPRGGTLTFETANVVVDQAMARNHRGLAPGRYSTLAVRDTGTGMDLKTKARIFEPFFTTKENGKGTGLGLATVYGIVKQSGGYIAVDSKPGKGATFRIFLPCEENGVAAPAVVDRALPESLSGNGTILLVEDEEKVRKLVREFLRQCGYTVLQAQNGGEALDLAHQHPSIDLLLSDVVMPGLSGCELALRLNQLRPQMRVVLMSGYANAGKTERGSEEPGTILLQKPFSLEELGRKVREVLGARKM